MNRKTFVRNSLMGLAGSTLFLNGCNPTPDKTIGENKVASKYKWKMVTTWPPNFPVLGEGCTLFSKWVEEMSGGEMTIKVFGAGELIPALEVFDAVTSGAAEIGNGVSYYWAGKHPACQFFTTIPFGMNAQQMNAWLYSGEGQALWDELYRKFGLKPFPAGNTGVQMGGWFNKEINTIQDLRGLKIRMPGLGGKVLSKFGATALLVSGTELYTSLERGVIDGTEWIGPYHDYIMGFHNIAKFYYAPGWHEPGSVLENIFNLRAFETLPQHLQTILETACARLNMWVLSEFEAKNNIYLQKIISSESVQLKKFNPEILDSLKMASKLVLDEVAAHDELTERIYRSYKAFSDDIRAWSAFSEKLYYEL